MNKPFNIVGIDGGGTKTLGVLWDEKGNEVKRVEHGFANFSVDILQTKINIEKTIDDLVKDLKGEIYIVMGISGVSNLRNQDEYIKVLNSKYKALTIIETDGLLALYSVVRDSDNPVIMIIGGTGSIVYSLKEGQTNRLGGYGHLLGDEGSAYHLVISAFKTVINNFEANNKLDEFSKELLKLLNVDEVEDLKKLVYGVSKSEVAKHAVHVSALALKGNKKAIKLLENEGINLANQIFNAYKKMKTSEIVKVALRGGFVNKAPFVKEALIKKLENKKMNFEIDQTNLEPIMGAYYLGNKLKGSKKYGRY
ncbi:MAG TPA: hypothetical protein GX742_01600 [Acholeplasmataceae bacterium]|nr:hypothetical protein [Acholeplasmataceae bacterium]